VPSGARVFEKGVELSGTGGTYRLPPGSHLLELRSPSGESTTVPVSIKVNEQVSVCYSFDTNSRCSP
jgi:hypothetical protein